MSDQEKIKLLEDAFELDEGTLMADAMLSELDCWDSMAKLTLIVLMDDECGKTLKSDDIKKFVTVQDILDYME